MRTLRGQTAIVGIGETTYYRHGQSPDAEFKLALQAVVAACKDAGISPHDIDGFASYGNDRSEAGRLAAALGIKELRFSNMFWGGGGGGVCGAVGNAAAAVATGMADCVVAFRSLAQGPVRALWPRHRGATRRGRRPVQHPLRRHVAGAALRHEGDALHARSRHPPGGAAGDLARLLPPRAEQPQRGDARPTLGRGEIRRLALDHRAVLPPVRLLHGERRRRRGDRGPGRPGARLPAQAGLGDGLRAGLRPPQRRAGAQHAELPQLAFPPDWASALRHGEADAGRHGHRAVLREFYRRRADEPGRARPGARPRKPTNSWSPRTCSPRAEKCR